MKKALNLLSVIVILLFSQCNVFKGAGTSNNVQASITKEGLINCFEKGLTAAGQPVWCEASAILYDGKKVFVANDKDMPDKRSSVFYWPFANDFADTTLLAQYLQNPLLKSAKKFEDFAVTPNGKMVFLSTGFDRTKPGSAEWNGYNTILYWQAGHENEPHVLSDNNTDSSSVFLRDKISKVLTSPEFPTGMPYFKIEGFAATGDMLYFGVREEGKKFDDFKYKTKIVSVDYSVSNGIIRLGNQFKVNDFSTSSIQRSSNEPMGLSSIEYDHYNKRFLILTSFENGDKHGGFLWVATKKDLENNRLNLVKDANGKPVTFTNKAEDIAIINKRKVLIIHDDDRTKSKVAGRDRQPEQAAFSVVEFK